MVDLMPFESRFQEPLVSMILDIQQKEFNIPITRAEQPDLYQIDTFYRGNGGEFWLASLDGEVVGSIALIHIGNRHGVIRKMFVKAPFRGQELGIAKRLLDGLVSYAHQMGITDLYLGTVHQLQGAIRFYEKNGFQRIEKIALPPQFPLIPIDDVFCHMKILKPLSI